MKPVFEIINEHITAGRGADARRVLKKLAEGKIARADRVAVAALARRANLHSLGVHLLNPIVRPKGKKLDDATDQEKAEYAASLTYLGAADEALILLKQVDTQKIPEALLYEAFAYFGQWDYAQGIPHLKKFIQATEISDYQRLVGQVNLAAAFVYEGQHQNAAKLLSELLEATQGDRFTLLRGNCLELSAQNALHQKEWRAAQAFLSEAETLLADTDSDERFFVQKWKVILEFIQKRSTEGNLGKLHRIRSEAQTEQHWETVRDCDRFEAVHTHNKQLLAHLYFGTPYESFRRRLIEDFSKVDVPRTYDWHLRGGKSTAGLNLVTGKDNRSTARLKVGQAPHRLLVTLASDFYKPVRVAVAHAKLFPGEHFNPLTAPPRVYEIVRRLRGWFDEHKVPLSIQENVGYYSLKATHPYTIHIESSPNVVNRQGNLAEQLHCLFPKLPFSLHEAGQALSLSDRSALRIITGLKKESKIERIGNGPSTRYRFKS